MESRPHLLPHEPALDGMRALAVIAVLLYHGHVSWMQGGFLGVDVFFVLSGFLITSLLLAEWNGRGAIDLRAFWLRRCRRLLPAMLVVVAAVSAYAAVLATRDELDELRADTLATLGYAANWRAIAVGDQYGDLFSVPSPLQHTWSLAIEEQWYLLWPLVLLGLLFAARRHAAIPLAAIGTMVLGSTVLMAWVYDPADLARSYYGTDTRCQSLLVGAGLALVVRHVRVGRWIPVFAIAALAWLWTTTPLEATWLYHGGFLLTRGAGRGGDRRRDTCRARARRCCRSALCLRSASSHTGCICGIGRCTWCSPRRGRTSTDGPSSRCACA